MTFILCREIENIMRVFVNLCIVFYLLLLYLLKWVYYLECVDLSNKPLHSSAVKTRINSIFKSKIMHHTTLTNSDWRRYI